MNQQTTQTALTPSTFSYIMGELTRVCPLPVSTQEFFRIQIRSNDGHATKWLNISPEQFKKIELVLLGIEE